MGHTTLVRGAYQEPGGKFMVYYFLVSLNTWSNKVNMLTHTYPHKTLWYQAGHPLYLWPDV